MSDELRVSDTERERVIDVLAEAVGEGRLTLDEYSERAATTYAARTKGELAEVTKDLPVAHVRESAPAVAAPEPEQKLSAFLGSESRKGRWVVPERLQINVTLGDCSLELDDAVLQHRVTTIDANVLLGSVTLYVPDGIDVRMSGRALLGSKESKVRGAPHEGAPIIHVRCDVKLGSVNVRPPKWRPFRQS